MQEVQSRSLLSHTAKSNTGRKFEGSSWSRPWPGALVACYLLYLAAFVGSLALEFAAHRAGLPQARWNPFSDPLMGDLMEYPGTLQLTHRAAFFDNASPGSLPPSMFSAVAYPPFAVVLLAPLYLAANPTWLFLTTAACWLVAALWCVRKALLKAGLTQTLATAVPLTVILTSFPVQRLVHQGNIELWVWMFVATGTCAFLRRWHWLTATLWGMAAAIKLYPLLLLLLLAPRRRYGAFLLGYGVFISTSWLSLLWLGPTTSIAFAGSVRNICGYHQLRTAEWSLRELVANHSAFDFVKLWAQIAHTPPSHFTMTYYVCGGAMFLWAYFRRLAKMPVTNQLLAVTVGMLLLPTISYYHTLVHLYAPLLLIVISAIQARQAELKMRGLGITLLLFIPLFMPYTLYTFPKIFLFCGLMQSGALGILFLCALEFPFPIHWADSFAGVHAAS